MKQKLLFIIALLCMVAGTAWAESTWEVKNSNGASNTFTIKRSETGYVQKVLYRTISLSAYAGQHFTAKNGELEFLADEDEKTVTVSELTPTDAYLYYKDGTTVKYGFEVTDRAGFRLAYAERKKTWGTSVPASGAFSIKDITIETSEYLNTDDGYDNNVVKSVNSSSYFSSTNTAPKAYYQLVGAELRMTLSMDVKEYHDGYQYMSILNSTTLYDNRKDCSNGDPGNISNSWYMAGFEHKTGGKDESYKSYSFPVTSVGNDAGHSNPWGHGTDYILSKQKFNTNRRASDGRLLLPMDFSVIAVRCNASGSDEDNWYAKNVKAHIQAVDGTNPTKSAVSVNPGRHAKGNTVYVSVAFSEIVTVTGTPTLTTTTDNHWGSLTYVEGSGTNVLTFSTTIPQDATGSLNITGLSGTVKDLAGNSLSGGVTASNLCSVDADLVYAISEFQTNSGNYLITCHDDLRGLAGFVNSGGDTSGKTFLQMTDLSFPHSDNWNNASSTENNFTAIGGEIYKFNGTYDGGSHTISGIRIYKGGTSASDKYQGLFGFIKNGTVRNVNLADTRITGNNDVGGIAGYSDKNTVEDCTVGDNVCIHAAQTGTRYHGGIVGYSYNSTVERCISRATHSVANSSNCTHYGGIAGLIHGGTLRDCLAIGAVIPSVGNRGIIYGEKSNITPTRNYFLGCTGMDQASNIFSITLGTNVTIARTPEATLPGTNNYTYANGADIAGEPYGYEGATVALGYSGEVPTGYHVEYTATAGTIDGSTLTMPAAAVSVGTEFSANSYSVHFDANGGSGSMSDMSFTYDEAQNLTANTFTGPTGYVFNGWNTRADGNGASYTNQQEASNLTPDDGATVTLYAQWADVWGMAGEADGTVQHPYTITTTAGLDLLAADVNNGNKYQYTYFVLGDDITYPHTTDWDDATSEENNYTAIGKYSEDHFFAGIFNGQYHTISGIRIYKPDTDYQGLFGKIASGAHVKNVTLTDARITAKGYVGGIAGNTYSVNTKIDNCLILNAAITDQGCCGGALVGYKDAGTYSHNFYRNCTVKVGSNTYTTNIGLGDPQNDFPAEVGSVHTLTLPDGVTASGESVVIDDVTYYANKNTITLSGLGTEHTNGDITFRSRATVTYNTDQTLTTNADADGQATFTMPAADATVTAKEYAYTAKYIAADGTEQTCVNPTIIESSTGSTVMLGTDGEEHWFVVSGDVSITNTGDGALRFNGAARLILCDGASLTLSGSWPLTVNGNLVIYGQSQGTGSLTAEGSAAIKVYEASTAVADNGTLTINGGSITAHSTDNNCIDVDNSITINGGTVSATSDNQFGRGINSLYGDVTVNGGTISATGGDRSYGIEAKGNITLGWTNPIDHIYASNYYAYGTISVKTGQTLMDGSAAYSGTVDKSAIGDKTLWPDLWDVAGGNDGSSAAKAYTITTTGGLDQLAAQVKNSNSYAIFYEKFFRLGNDITYSHTTAWNDATSEENNFTPIGSINNGSYKYFSGTFDGQGHTVRGIRIYKAGTTTADNSQGLFGLTSGATIKNVILADARITGRQEVGGIAGYLGGTVENCRVGSDVTIHAAANYASTHGGVVGICSGGTIRGCVSAATLTVASGLTGINTYGGIVGYLNGNMSDCLAIGASVPAVDNRGAIAGLVYDDPDYTQTNNYHHGCTVGGNTAPSDANNVSAYTVSAGTDVTVALAGDADATYTTSGIQRYGSALYYGGVIYAPEAADVSLTLGNTVTPAESFDGYCASAGTLSGTANPYTLTMPAGDVTVTAYVISSGYCGMASVNSGQNVIWTYSPSTTTLTISPNPDVSEQTDFRMANYGESNQPWNDYKGAITTLVIDAGVTSIGNRACYNCTSLTAISLPDGLTTIGGYAFYGCNLLTAITLPASVTSIGLDAFRGCSKLESMNIPDGVTTINDRTFWGCSSLENIHIPTGVTSIGGNAFIHCSSLKSITLPDGLTSIGMNAFYGCSKLESITIPANVTSIGEDAFAGCSKLATIIVLPVTPPAITYNNLGNFDSSATGKSVYFRNPAYMDNDGWSTIVNTKGYALGFALVDNGENDIAAIDTYLRENDINIKNANIMLYGRTLYRDGDWNTLCLPFDVGYDKIPYSTLCDATIMYFDWRYWYDADGNCYWSPKDGYHRSGEVENGNLHLYFYGANQITAGSPYIVKWETTGAPIVNPVFRNVTVNGFAITPDNYTTDEGPGNVTCRGTYSPVTLKGGNKSLLFLGSNNNLYYPATDRTIGAFRVYFELGNGLTVGDPESLVKGFNLSFCEGDEATRIEDGLTPDPSPRRGEEWYDLNGRKIDNSKFKIQNSKLPRGIYIHNGRKVVVK